MTQFPPPPPLAQYGSGYPSAPRRSNGPAIASLVLGIVGCVPFISGLLAIILGIIGIRKTRDPAVGGKGMAIAGIILGILSILSWVGLGGAFYSAYKESDPARVVARQFLTDLTTGNINAAMANSSGFSSTDLQTQNLSMASYGMLQSVSFNSFNLSYNNGQSIMRLGGVATFSNGQKTCTFDLSKSNGVYKVTAFSVQ
jgi:hypothetical protein